MSPWSLNHLSGYRYLSVTLLEKSRSLFVPYIPNALSFPMESICFSSSRCWFVSLCPSWVAVPHCDTLFPGPLEAPFPDSSNLCAPAEILRKSPCLIF